MNLRILIGAFLVAAIWAGAFLAGQRLGSMCPAGHHEQAILPANPAQGIAAASTLAPDASVRDPHPEAFMIHDRAGHISSSRVWKFEDDWFADGGKLGCRRFSTEGATLEFCLDPYKTGTGCAGWEDPSSHHTHR